MYLRLGEKEKRVEHFVKAAADIQRVTQLNPYYYDAFFQLAWMYINGPEDLRSPEKALSYALRGNELRRDEQPYLSVLGQVYYRLGKLEEARKTLENDFKVENERLKAGDWVFLAMIHHQRGDRIKAEEFYQKARHWREAP